MTDAAGGLRTPFTCSCYTFDPMQSVLVLELLEVTVRIILLLLIQSRSIQMILKVDPEPQEHQSKDS